MAGIAWQDKFSVNIKTIDRQHRQLFGLIKQLDAAMGSGRSRKARAKALKTLLQNAQANFSCEERLMTSHGYPEYVQHKTEHKVLTQKVAQLQSVLASQWMGLSIPIAHYLAYWLTDHMLGTDKKCGLFLNCKGVT